MVAIILGLEFISWFSSTYSHNRSHALQLLAVGYPRDLVFTVIYKFFNYVARDPKAYNGTWLLQKCGAMLALSFEQHIEVGIVLIWVHSEPQT